MIPVLSKTNPGAFFSFDPGYSDNFHTDCKNINSKSIELDIGKDHYIHNEKSHIEMT